MRAATIATRGRVSAVKAAVTIATMGLLIIAATPTQQASSVGSGGGDQRHQTYHDRKDHDKEERERLEECNNNLMIISELFIKYLT